MTTSVTPATLAARTFIPFRPAEVKVFRRRVRLSGPEWAEKNIVVPLGPQRGPYRNRNNPALYGLLDLACQPHVRRMVMGKGIQNGGTLWAYIVVLRGADYSNGGGNALIVMADESSSKKLSKGRLRKLINQSPSLSAIKSANPDDLSIFSIVLADGFQIDIGWISSETSVSSESYETLVLDEISKPAFVKHRSSIADAHGRTTVFPETKKELILSSPGLDSDDPTQRDPLLDEMDSCDVMLDYYVICPDCGVEQVMIFENFWWPEQPGLLPGSTTVDPAGIRRNKLARYRCTHCKSLWNDYKRDKAVLASMKTGWRPTEPGIDYPQSVYVHYPSWLSPYMSLSEVAARWIEAQGDADKLRKWHNLIAGISYRNQKQERPHSAILALRDDRPEGLVPSVPIAAISCTADMQRRGFWYKITAWGFGLEQESWTLKAGFVDSWAALRLIMFESQFEDINKKPYNVTLRGLDSGGGEGFEHADLSRTAEAYLFAAANPGVVLFKGRRHMSRQYNVTDLDRMPGTNKALPGSAKLYTIHTTFFKDKLAGKLLVSPGDPGAWHLHQEVDEDFAKQMCAEYRSEQGVWECPKGKDNHYFDCSTMELALVEIHQVKIWSQTTEIREQKQKQHIQKQARW